MIVRRKSDYPPQRVGGLLRKIGPTLVGAEFRQMTLCWRPRPRNIPLSHSVMWSSSHNGRSNPMYSFALIGLALLLAGSAQAQSIGEKSGINSVLGTSPSTQDFVT